MAVSVLTTTIRETVACLTGETPNPGLSARVSVLMFSVSLSSKFKQSVKLTQRWRSVHAVAFTAVPVVGCLLSPRTALTELPVQTPSF